VASKKGLSLVVDKSAVIYGGTDITKEVSDSLNKTLTASQSAAASQSK
jgi:outer membrane protein